jgi:outer membrane protein TolC
VRARPDLRGARAVEALAVARLARARAESGIDASLKAGYQRMRSGFPLSGFDEAGALQPIESDFQFFTFGVEIDLPVRNRNQGEIEAAVFEREAAQKRIEFGELTVRREVNVAYARYNRAVRALTIFQNGVRDQAGANLRVVWQTYEFGRRTLSDYIGEERRFLEIENELIDVVHIADGVAITHFWSRLAAGAAHPAGPHKVDTLILAVLTRQNEKWHIQALENVTLTNARTGETILRG